ncbi:MAG: hypothetical protein MZV64_37165 [Ignavibacteriales bacterium]|nr:hypothetical protein [Ignavibacteriales bacterium]
MLQKIEHDIIPITRLTALWALSESMLGGLLHAAHIPFGGNDNLISGCNNYLFNRLFF